MRGFPETRLELRPATTAEILALRHAALRAGLPFETARFEGDDEPDTRHVGAFLRETGDIVGCVTFVVRPWRGAPARQLRGMATRADLVRRGIGRALLRFADGMLEAVGGPRLLWCNARVPAVPFYERLGWTVVSDEFEIPTAGPHREMITRAGASGASARARAAPRTVR